MKTALLFWLCLAFVAVDPSFAQAQTIPVLSYYETAPFHFPQDNKGLVREIMEELDKTSPELDFEYQIVPRPLLNEMFLKRTDTFLIPLTHPLWFNDKHRQKYSWSIPLYEDFNTLMSPISAPVEFKGHKSFLRKSVGVPSGFKIYLLDELIQTQEAQRIDIDDMELLLTGVLSSRFDMAVIPNAVGRYMVKTHHAETKVYFSKRPQQSYKRYFLFKNSTQAQMDALNSAITTIQKNGKLKEILSRYGY